VCDASQYLLMGAGEGRATLFGRRERDMRDYPAVAVYYAGYSPIH